MTFTLTIEMNNAAFTDDPREVSRILKELASRVHPIGGPGDGGKVRDSNGNTVGSWEVVK